MQCRVAILPRNAKSLYMNTKVVAECEAREQSQVMKISKDFDIQHPNEVNVRALAGC